MDQYFELNDFKRQVSAFYDHRSSNYDAGKLQAIICQELFNYVSVDSGNTVLDIGTGTGRLAFLAAQSVGPSGQVIGVDIAPKMLELAKTKAHILNVENVEFILADAEQLYFSKERFDLVLCANTFPWIQNKAASLSLWHKFLKPRGVIAVHLPASTAYTANFILRRVLFKYGVSLESTNRVGTKTKLLRLFAKAGFKSLKIQAKQHGRYSPMEEMQRAWENVLENPSITSPKVLNKAHVQLPSSQLRKIKAEFYEELASLNTEKGIWNDLTTLYVLGHKS